MKSKVLTAIIIQAYFLLPLMGQESKSAFPEGNMQIDFVNPFIGTTNYGATHPGALVPHGMVSVVPFNVTGSLKYNKFDKDNQWWSAPYSWDNAFFTGFSHVNLSGVGCPDLGVIQLMPLHGELSASIKEYGSVMSRQQASPAYYACHLDDYGIAAEATATARTGLSRFTFPQGTSHVLLDLGNGLTNEQGAYLKVVNAQEVEGWRMTGNFCYQGQSERPVYFVARLSRPADSFGVWKKMPVMKAEKAWSSTADAFKFYENYTSDMAGDSIGAWFSFQTTAQEQILVKVGVSYVSIENARMNLETEQPGFDFESVLSAGKEVWERALSVIDVEGGSHDQKVMFYTALYHTQFHPNIFNDVNGEFPMMEKFETGHYSQRNRYTVFSLWDTYRTVHPLYSLLYPAKQLDMVRTMVDMYKESGWLPKWELNGKETFTMSGDPAFPVIADTYLRGLTDFDVETAYEAMLKSATTPEKENKIRKNHDFYVKHGYVPLMSTYDNSVAEALEYYIADWSLGQLAKVLGRTADYQEFTRRSLQYVNYFDKKEFKMLRPKKADGSFFEPFDPEQGKNFEPVPGFHEGTAWQYTFGVPHHIEGMIKLVGGEKKFTQMLQHIFDAGLFDMTNEPDMHYPFLFNYVKGQEWRSQKEVSRLMTKYFKNAPDGLPGNDDCGTMSAWLVFSMMGLYPVCPADMNFAISSPVFDKITLHLDSNYYPASTFVITKKQKGNDFIKSISLNQKPLKGFFISHQQIVNGGEMRVE